MANVKDGRYIFGREILEYIAGWRIFATALIEPRIF